VSFTGSERILQVHPTRRCNLRCLHCYSDSSPEASDELEEAVVLEVVADAAALGYTVLSVSGGEPFLYRPLPALLLAARDSGMRTQVITNGLPVTERNLAALRGALDLLALSLDGGPEDHDRMRARTGTFTRLTERLAVIRDGIPFGLLFTLTMFNVHQLEWAAEYALSEGARLLQVHPLEATGRAASLVDEVPDDIEAGMALLEATRLQQRYAGRLAIHVDIATVGGILGSERSALPSSGTDDLSSAVSPLVIEPDGMCVPFEYGFPRSFALGDIRRARLRDLADAWLRDGHPRLQDRRARLDGELGRGGEAVVVNWYERLRASAQAAHE
jgi:Fe-coproporphyrin III synthase